ncbi:MAG TPA: hypothetical protein VMO20_09560 [Candidatus Acidoferrum sp.]|nr:hypothetical protein [Candidatus Acidoferrum sp.]
MARVSNLNVWALNEICEAIGALGNRMARMIDFLGRVPKDVKLKIRGCPVMGSLKFVNPRLHNLLGRFEGHMGINRITARPQERTDLVARNLTATANGLVVITTLDHREGRPTIHRARRRNQSAQRNQHC